MKFKLNVASVYELGQRANQEDNMYPEHGMATGQDRLFIICDGMGGHSAGEVASRLVCESMSRAICDSCQDPEGTFTDEDFKAALAKAFDALDLNDNGDVKKMGTTMTFLKFHKDGVTIAHIGDSRVYHVRPAADADNTEILFQTSDHSLVNDLVKIGEMTPEEAKVSNQKNIITRAMQPNLERRPAADIQHVSDIRPGDYFFMCSDGILEHMEDENVKYIFSDQTGNIQEKAALIVRATAENRDNHTAFLIRVEEVEETSVAHDPKHSCDHAEVDVPAPKKPSCPCRKNILWPMLALLCVVVLGWMMYVFVIQKDTLRVSPQEGPMDAKIRTVMTVINDHMHVTDSVSAGEEPCKGGETKDTTDLM